MVPTGLSAPLFSAKAAFCSSGDSGFNRYNDYINGEDIKVKSNDKRLRKLLKKNHRLVNGLDRSTLEFMYGTKNPNIEKMIKNAKRIL